MFQICSKLQICLHAVIIGNVLWLPPSKSQFASFDEYRTVSVSFLGLSDYVVNTELRMRFSDVWTEISDGLIHVTRISYEQRKRLEAEKSKTEDEK